MRRYTRADADLHAGGGYAAESEAAQMAHSLGIEDRVLGQPLKTLSGGQRRRVELARILFSGADSLLLDEPTNHLDADSIVWLRDFLKSHQGGLVVISHDTALLEATVNRVLHLDANRAEIDVYNMGWSSYLTQRETDEKRRKRERMNAENKAKTLTDQANRMRAKATKAQAAQSMLKRAEKLLAGVEGERRQDRVARIKFPAPAPCGKTPLTAAELSKSYGSLEVFTDVDLAIDRGSRVVVLGLNGAGKTTLLRILAGVDRADTGAVTPGHGLKIGYYAQEQETLDTSRTVLQNLHAAAPQLADTEARSVLGSFLFSGDDADKPASVLSGGEKTRLALAILVGSSANVLLLDEPTNNLDPASREEVLAAIRSYEGAIVLVTHDEGAVHALEPDRVLILPRRGRGPVERRVRRPGGARLSRPWPHLDSGHDSRRACRRRAAARRRRRAATVTLHRPEVRNAQTPAMWHALADVGASLGDEVRVVVVRGEGPTFSAGLDRALLDPATGGDGSVVALMSQSDEQVSTAIDTFQRGFTWLRDPRFVSIAAVQGYAIGAGFQLALSCDLIVAADTAQFSMKEAALGLVPDLTGTQPLLERVGYPRALEICATARMVGAEEAVRIGIALAAVPEADLDRGRRSGPCPHRASPGRGP